VPRALDLGFFVVKQTGLKEKGVDTANKPERLSRQAGDGLNQLLDKAKTRVTG